jgi:hypothetical protein
VVGGERSKESVGYAYVSPCAMSLTAREATYQARSRVCKIHSSRVTFELRANLLSDYCWRRAGASSTMSHALFR